MSSIQQLRSLADRPQEQAHFALTLLKPQQPRDVLLAALACVRAHPVAQAREPLLALYAHLSAAPEKRDPAGYLRRPLLDALRPVATAADIPLLQQAAATYERYPPSFTEEAGLVRAAGLIALNEIDEQLAAFHAARILADLTHTDEMSGEPAASAARVLGAQRELLPLYLYVMLPVSAQANEATAECLRQLTTLQESLLEPLVQHYAECADPIMLIGLFELLLGHEAGVQGVDFMIDFLQTTDQPDLYRYLVTAIVAAGQPGLMASLLEMLRWEQNRDKRAMAADALQLRAADPDVADALERLQ